MSVPVVAKNDLDGYILETTIVVKIPQGTEGLTVQEVRKDVVIVQFDVPSLGPLRVDRRDLLIADSLDVIVETMERILNTKPFIEKDAHRAADELLIRTLQTISTDENQEKVSQLIRLFQELPKHYQ